MYTQSKQPNFFIQALHSIVASLNITVSQTKMFGFLWLETNPRPHSKPPFKKPRNFTPHVLSLFVLLCCSRHSNLFFIYE